MGFSLLSGAEFFVFRKMEIRSTKNHPLCGCGPFVIQDRLVEESCEHYAVIDKEIVWYESVNLLSKEDAEDNLMRVYSKNIAAELLEMTFGFEADMQEWQCAFYRSDNLINVLIWQDKRMSK